MRGCIQVEGGGRGEVAAWRAVCGAVGRSRDVFAGWLCGCVPPAAPQPQHSRSTHGTPAAPTHHHGCWRQGLGSVCLCRQLPARCLQPQLVFPSPTHLPLGAGTGDQLAFDYVARFGVAVPILSFTALWSPGSADGEANGSEAPTVELHCVQTTAIQQYSLDPALCSEGSSAGGRGSDMVLPQEEAANPVQCMVAGFRTLGSLREGACCLCMMPTLNARLVTLRLGSRRPSAAEPEEAEERGVTQRSGLLERHGKDFRLPIQAQPSSAVPMPSEELATGTPRGVTSPSAPPVEQLPVPASEEAVAAAEAAAAPHLEPSIDELVPLASIPLPPAPELPVPKASRRWVAKNCC